MLFKTINTEGLLAPRFGAFIKNAIDKLFVIKRGIRAEKQIRDCMDELSKVYSPFHFDILDNNEQ